jgi:ribosomal-protein-alanine N-acetyltransferase
LYRESFSKKGLATEATKAVIQYGFEKINLHKVQVCHKSINIPSKKVIQKCGFIYEGTLRDFFYMDGQYMDRLYYSILRDEFQKTNQLQEPYFMINPKTPEY